MLTAHRYCPGGSLLVLFVLACSSSELVEPADNLTFMAVSGSNVRAPSSITAIVLSMDQLFVTWQDNSGNETGFEVHRSTTGAGGSFALQSSEVAGTTSYLDEGLTASTQYCYKVRAFRRAGGKTSYSEFSSTACGSTMALPVPAAPSDIEGLPVSSTAVTLIWLDNSYNEDGFRVERSLDQGSVWTSAGTVTGGRFQDTGLPSEQQVCYRVIAFNSWGDSPPSSAKCMTLAAGPSDLTATGTDGPAIDLTWTDNSAVEDGYLVLSASYGPPTGIVAELPPNSTSYHAPWVSANATYQFLVRAKTDGGLSDDSNIATATAGNCVPTNSTDICGNGLDDECNGAADDDPACPVDCSWGCALGYMCGDDGFCVSHCSDGVQNGDEIDVDCGESCGGCAVGQNCSIHAHCTSGNCDGSVCQP
jgi:hypothetical protein